MHPHQLERNLKTLRLSGMLETLEMRVQQAREGQLGYLAFLEMLLEDEVNRRAQRALIRRQMRARFEELKSLADFDFRYNPNIPAQTLHDLASCGFIERKESVILYGPVGVGKSRVPRRWAMRPV